MGAHVDPFPHNQGLSGQLKDQGIRVSSPGACTGPCRWGAAVGRSDITIPGLGQTDNMRCPHAELNAGCVNVSLRREELNEVKLFKSVSVARALACVTCLSSGLARIPMKAK